MQKLVPDVWQLVFANVAIEGGSCTCMNIASLIVLDGALDFLVYDVELIRIQWVPCGGAV